MSESQATVYHPSDTCNKISTSSSSSAVTPTLKVPQKNISIECQDEGGDVSEIKDLVQKEGLKWFNQDYLWRNFEMV